MKPLAPKTILQNRYQIKKLIGKGGMGEVYLAIDQRLGHKVALKRTTVSHDMVLTEAFEREAKTLAQLRHSVLPKVSDHFVEEDEQYLIMEYISGEDLSQKLKATNKPFPLNWVMFWADQLLESLTYLHTYDPPIIHRDIKPQNLKLTDENQIVLLDFGLSKNTVNKDEVTTSGSVVGYTPHYAPMEQIRGTGTNASSDVFSLSATLYHLLSNTIPSDALTRADAMLSGLPDPLKPLTKLNPEITQAISDAILKGMSINQSNRFKTARDMQKVLRRAFNDMQNSMSAQTVAFNVSAEEIIEADSKTEEISNVPIKTEEIPDSALPVDSDNQTVTHQPNYETEVPIASFSSTDYSADKTEVINAEDFPSEVNMDNSVPNSQYSENVSESADSEPTGMETDVINNEDLTNNTIQDNFTTQEEIPAEIPVDEEFRTNEDVATEDFKTNGDVDVNEEFSPDATVPLITMDEGIVENEVSEENLETADDSSWDEEFDSAGNVATNEVIEEEVVESAPESVGFTEEFSNNEVLEESDSQPSYQTQSKAESVSAASVAANSTLKPQKEKSSTGKYLAILGGLGAVFFLLIGSAVGIGLYYNGTFGGGGNTEPTTVTTPNTQVTPEQAPTVEQPEPEIVESENTNSEVNSETETDDGNTETTESVDPTVEDDSSNPTTESSTSAKTDRTSTSRTSTRTQDSRTTKSTRTQNTRPTRNTRKTTTTKKSTKKDTKNTKKKPTPKPKKKKPKNAGVL